MEAEWWRKYGNPEDFPVGTRVVTRKCGVDFRFFGAGHAGTVIRNEMRYLSVIVEFDNPIHHFIDDEPTGLTTFNFHPENLVREDLQGTLHSFEPEKKKEYRLFDEG